MEIANISFAKGHLSALIKKALAGDDVVIARGNEPLVRLVPIQHDTRPRAGGQWAGLITRGEYFEFTDRELDELIGMDPKSADS